MAAKTASLSVNIIADAAKARAGLKEAETAFGRFRTEVGNTEGAMGKFKIISGTAFDYVKQNAVAFASAAGTAIATFAIKSVMAFQDLALEAGKFADATGLSTEQASRFIEVAGDIGIEAGTVEKALNFMNKTLGNSPELFKSLGVQIAYAANGSRDANDTFLNVVKRLNEIKDPAERAAVATKLLGRGWTEMSELIAMGSGDLAKSLAAVSDAKIIDPGEVQRAKDFRQATDDLKDAWEDFSLTVGETALPALTGIMKGFSGFFDLVKKIPGGGTFFGLDAMARIMDNNKVSVELAAGALDNFGIGLGTVAGQIDNTSYASEAFRREMGKQVAAVDELKTRWDIFRGALNLKAEYLQLQSDMYGFRDKWAGVTDDAKQKSSEYQISVLNMQSRVAAFAETVQGIATWAQMNRIQVAIETGRLEYAVSLILSIRTGLDMARTSADQAERAIANAMRAPAVYSVPATSAPPVARPPSTTTPTRPTTGTVQTVRIPHLASGGSVVSSGLAMVGEQGPEVVSLPRGASVIPSIPSRKMMGGGTTVNIQVQAGLVSSPEQVGQQIIEAIRRAERRSGQVFAAI